MRWSAGRQIATDFSESSLIVPSTPPLSCLIVLTAEAANLMLVERGENRDIGIYHKATKPLYAVRKKLSLLFVFDKS